MIEKRGPIRVVRYMSALFNNLNFGIFSAEFLKIATSPLMREMLRQIIALPLGVDVIVLDRQPELWRGFRHPFTHFATHRKSEPHIPSDLGRRERRRLGPRQCQATAQESQDLATTPATLRRLRICQVGDYRRGARDARRVLCAKKQRFDVKGIPNIFAPPATRAFLQQLAAESIDAKHKLIEMHAISLADGTLCALSALSRKGGHVICQFSSIKPSLTEPASPGELLFFHTIRAACEAGDSLFDFGAGDEQFKLS